MKATIVFVDGTERVFDDVDAKRIESRFSSIHLNDATFVVTDNLIINVNEIKAIYFDK